MSIQRIAAVLLLFSVATGIASVEDTEIIAWNFKIDKLAEYLSVEARKR